MIGWTSGELDPTAVVSESNSEEGKKTRCTHRQIGHSSEVEIV
jgi:hypothetical protein